MDGNKEEELKWLNDECNNVDVDENINLALVFQMIWNRRE